MKVLVVSNTAWSILNFRKYLIERLAERASVSVISDGRLNEDDFDSPITLFDVPYDGRSCNLIKQAYAFYKFAILIKKIDPDLVFTFTIKPNIYFGLINLLMKIKWVPTITGLGSQINKKKNSFLNALYSFSLKTANSVIFQNIDDQIYAANNMGLPSDKSTICPGSGVDCNSFYKREKFNTEEVKVLFCGRPLVSKGLDLFMDLSEYYAKEDKKVNFTAALLVVSDCYDKDILERAKACSGLNLLVNNEEIPEVIGTHDIIILPTEYNEGCPKVLLEALASGLFIVTVQKSWSEKMIESGINGEFCEPGKLDSLIDAVETYLGFSLQQMERVRSKSRQIALENYDNEIVFRHYENFLNCN